MYEVENLLLMFVWVFQVPFDLTVKKVLEQLRVVAKGEYTTPTGSEKRKFGNIVFCAVSLPVTEIVGQLDKVNFVPVTFQRIFPCLIVCD